MTPAQRESMREGMSYMYAGLLLNLVITTAYAYVHRDDWGCLVSSLVWLAFMWGLSFFEPARISEPSWIVTSQTGEMVKCLKQSNLNPSASV